MAAAKIFEAEAWCPQCKTYVGKIFKKEIREGMYVHVTEPKVLPKRCSVCEGVIVRKS